MKKNRKFWIILIVLTLVVLSSLFFLQTNPVVAMFGGEHVVEVVTHLWNEVLPSHPSGRYYQALFFKHFLELDKMLNDYPEMKEDVPNLILLFMPVLEASPDDDSNSVRITEEQLDSLKLELDWITAHASPSLRSDIENELADFPREKFVGMTLYEALDYLDLYRDSTFITLPIPTPLPSPTPTATAYPTPTCKIGNAPDCLQAPALVDNSDGLWAYDIVDKVYFEYPSDWVVNKLYNPEMSLITFIPSLGSFEEVATRGIFFGVRSFIFPNEINYDEIGCSLNGASDQPNVLLHEPINLPDFKGNKVVWKDNASFPTIYIESVIYNIDHQLMVCWITTIDNDVTEELLTNPKIVDETFPNIQHILESIKMIDE